LIYHQGHYEKTGHGLFVGHCHPLFPYGRAKRWKTAKYWLVGITTVSAAIALAWVTATALNPFFESTAIAQTVPTARAPVLNIAAIKGRIEQRTVVLRLPAADTPVDIYTLDLYSALQVR
jgi:hypothetical protein